MCSNALSKRNVEGVRTMSQKVSLEKEDRFAVPQGYRIAECCYTCANGEVPEFLIRCKRTPHKSRVSGFYVCDEYVSKG